MVLRVPPCISGRHLWIVTDDAALWAFVCTFPDLFPELLLLDFTVKWIHVCVSSEHGGLTKVIASKLAGSSPCGVVFALGQDLLTSDVINNSVKGTRMLSEFIIDTVERCRERYPRGGSQSFVWLRPPVPPGPRVEHGWSYDVEEAQDRGNTVAKHIGNKGVLNASTDCAVQRPGTYWDEDGEELSARGYGAHLTTLCRCIERLIRGLRLDHRMDTLNPNTRYANASQATRSRIRRRLHEASFQRRRELEAEYIRNHEMEFGVERDIQEPESS